MYGIEGVLPRCIIMAFLVHSVICLSTISFAQNPDSVSGPKLVIGEDAFDFGTVKEGEVLEHAFKVFNKGDIPLEINNVKPT